jgi:hypothetical protein
MPGKMPARNIGKYKQNAYQNAHKKRLNTKTKCLPKCSLHGSKNTSSIYGFLSVFVPPRQALRFSENFGQCKHTFNK